MKSIIPEVGAQFGRWTVIDNTARTNSRTGKTRPACICKCECGNTGIIANSDLHSGHSKSCGCLRSDVSKSMSKHNSQGHSGTRIYRIWSRMRERCYDPRQPHYSNYGGRGITVCDEWRNDFMVFRDWALANGYTDDLSIDRIDYNGNYEPSNCRWATPEEQQNNTRWNLNLTLGNKTQSLSKWAHELDMPISTIYSRLDRGWDAESALTYPRYKHKNSYQRKTSA